MKLLFITDYDYTNPKLRSGVPFFLVYGLKQAGINHEVLVVADARSILQKLISRLKQFLCKHGFLGKAGFYDASYSKAMAKSYSKFWRKINLRDYDFVLSIKPQLLAYLPIETKTILWIDNTIQSYALYPEMKGISSISLKEGAQVEALVFKRAYKIFTASLWLKEYILSQIPTLSPTIHVLPRGANLPEFPVFNEVERAISNRLQSKHLCLVHVLSGIWDNDRKGTSLVINVYRILKKKIEVNLCIIGKVPKDHHDYLNSEGIHCIGYFDKLTHEGYSIYKSILFQAHFLFVPSKADGFGIIYAEAASFGLPSLACSVMGVTEAVKDGISGWLKPVETDASVWSEFIIEKFMDKQAYYNLSISAWKWSDNNFRWSKNLIKIMDIKD